MKRIFFIVCALLLCVCASAAELKPHEFLASKGLTILSQEQLSQMGGTNFVDFPCDMFAFSSPVEGNSSSIVVYYDGAYYVGINMASMFSNNGTDVREMSTIFIDLCNAYPTIDCCTFGGTEYTCYTKDTDTLEGLLMTSETLPLQTFHDLNEFLIAFQNSIS